MDKESMTEKTEVVWHNQAVQRDRGCVLWFTGLSGSGKSTVANRVDQLLDELNSSGEITKRSFLLDGDNVRHGLNASPEKLVTKHGQSFADRFGLGFGPEDREENIRRIGSVSEIFCSAGIVVLAAFVSPYRRDRQSVRELIESHGKHGDFIEVFVDTPIEVCEQRDPKGLYKKARAGEIRNFTGVDDPYEAPESPELRLTGGTSTVENLADQVVNYLRLQKLI
jgi:adenylylsulfate kinase